MPSGRLVTVRDGNLAESGNPVAVPRSTPNFCYQAVNVARHGGLQSATMPKINGYTEFAGNVTALQLYDMCCGALHAVLLLRSLFELETCESIWKLKLHI